MTLSGGHSCGNKIGGQEQRNPFGNLPVEFQRESSKENKDLISNVRTAVFSHLGVDPAESNTPPAKSPVELHVHHHHHLYVDNEQPPASPRILDGDPSAGKGTVTSKNNWKDYEEFANKALLDILWAKHQPYYGTSVTGRSRKAPKQVGANTTNSLKLHQTSGVLPAGSCPGDAKSFAPSVASNVQVGRDMKRASTKSKIRYLEETAQERIKKLSDLGTLVSMAEAECGDDFNTLRRREAGSQTHMDHCKYLSKNRPREELFREESQAAEASFVAALKSAKDRLRDLVNECARANEAPENALRKQKELQALEMLQYYFHTQDTSCTGASQERPQSPVTTSPSLEGFPYQTYVDPAAVQSVYMPPDETFTYSKLQELERRKPEPAVDTRMKEDFMNPPSPRLVHDSDVESPGISSTAEYMKLFQRYRVTPQARKEAGKEATTTTHKSVVVKSDLAKVVLGLSLNNVEDALQNLEGKLSNVENLRDQVVVALRNRKEALVRSAKESMNAATSVKVERIFTETASVKNTSVKVERIYTDKSTETTPPVKNVCVKPKSPESKATVPGGFTLYESPVYEPHTASREELVEMLRNVIKESEKLRASLEETKQRFLAEDRKNVLLKDCVGDPKLYEKEHAILDSALALNSELLDNFSGMNYALTSYGTATKNLLPFVEEHLAITERLREAASTPTIKELKAAPLTSTGTSSRVREASPLPCIVEEKLAPGGKGTSESSEVQLILLKEIEETKKQSREMVEIMDSLGQHYEILRAKFMESRQPGPAVEKLLKDGDTVLKGAEQLQKTLKSGSGEHNKKGDVRNLKGSFAQRRLELVQRLGLLEEEISVSHDEIQELKNQNKLLKNVMESRELEADTTRRQADIVQWRAMQLEEELMEKDRQIAALKRSYD